MRRLLNLLYDGAAALAALGMVRADEILIPPPN